VTENRKKSRENRFSFALSYTPTDTQAESSPRRKLTESLEFTCTNHQVLSIWLDGLSFLLEKPVVGESRVIADRIADIGVKVRLMDFALNECKIPEEGVEIPEACANHDYVFDERDLFGAYEMEDEDDRDSEKFVIDVSFE
jgi:hypothetical protein